MLLSSPPWMKAQVFAGGPASLVRVDEGTGAAITNTRALVGCAAATRPMTERTPAGGQPCGRPKPDLPEPRHRHIAPCPCPSPTYERLRDDVTRRNALSPIDQTARALARRLRAACWNSWRAAPRAEHIRRPDPGRRRDPDRLAHPQRVTSYQRPLRLLAAVAEGFCGAKLRLSSNRDAMRSTKARLGRGCSDNRVSKLEPACPGPGLRTNSFLVGAQPHIKPWRDATTASARGANGLLLSPHVDKLV